MQVLMCESNLQKLENMQNKHYNTHMIYGKHKTTTWYALHQHLRRKRRNVVAFGERVCLLIFQHKELENSV